MKLFLFSNRGQQEDFLFSREITSLLGVPVQKGAEGKPFVPLAKTFLSYTHTDKIAALLTAADPVGVDLERLRPLPFAALARRYFPPAEAKTVLCLEDFFLLWTKKESCFKLLGEAALVPFLKKPLPPGIYYETLRWEDLLLTIAHTRLQKPAIEWIVQD